MQDEPQSPPDTTAQDKNQTTASAEAANKAAASADAQNVDGAEQDQAASPELSPEVTMEQLQGQLAEAQAKAEENWDRCLRATAEQDNIRKRAERDVEAARRFALEKFAKDLLGVQDSLELGLKASQEAQQEARGDADTKHVEGLQITAKMLADALSRHGVQVIDPKGEAFDPEKHEAITAVPNPDMAPNIVLEVMQKGYSLNDRVLRPAMVVVSRAV